jgi:hypothetical protein
MSLLIAWVNAQHPTIYTNMGIKSKKQCLSYLNDPVFDEIAEKYAPLITRLNREIVSDIRVIVDKYKDDLESKYVK